METETQNIDLLDFQKIGKNGPYEILDDKIAEYITQKQLHVMVLNGLPYLYRRGYYKKDEDGKILKAHIKALIHKDLITIGRINRVYQLILADYRLSKRNDEINRYPEEWINFKNGMYDVMTGEMHGHSPEYFSINQIPHDYDPDAEFSGTVAELFFKGLIPDEADRKMFFAFAGYCMTRDTKFQKFLVLTGSPGTGKSTAINMLIDMIGQDNVSGIALQDLGDRFTPTELLGKLMNACADLPKKALEQVDAIKRITGEDQVKGEYKGGKVFWFKSYAKLIFSANQMPKSYDEKTFAFFRRILMIDIQRKGERIPDLKEGLAESMPAFIKVCVDCLRDVCRTGEEIDSPNSKKLVHEYYRSSDSVTAFLEDCTEQNPEARVKCKELYEKYELYCIDGQLRALTRNAFYDDIKAKGYAKVIYHGYPYFNGISPKTSPTGDFLSPTGDFLPINPTQEKLPFT